MLALLQNFKLFKDNISKNNSLEKDIDKNISQEKVYDESLIDKFYNNLNEGIKNFKLFLQNSDQNFLKLSYEKFYTCTEIIEDKPEPYFYLSFISYKLNDQEKAVLYINKAESINSNLHYISELKSYFGLN